MSGRGGTEAVLDIDALCIDVTSDSGTRRVVDGLSLSVAPGEVVALVGESGSGKTMTALAVMGLLPRAARIATGSIRFEGRSLADSSERELDRIRGRDVAMVFQSPFAALNPSHRIGDQVAEALLIHGTAPGRAEARERAVELLGLVGISEPEHRRRSYPHELSGGMRQRVVLAIAMANDPTLLIADEPTTALDVTVQAEVMEVLRSVRGRVGSAMLLITHNLGIVAGTADRVVVMRTGVVVEAGTVDEVFSEPKHPYTRELLAAVPRLPDEGRSGIVSGGTS